MSTSATTYDVFISHAPSDAKLAATVAEAFRQNGLEPFSDAEVGTAENASNVIWEALTESKALVAILSRGEPSPAMAVEIGAAQAWSKPIYAIASDPSSIRLPASLARVRLLAPGAIEDIIRDLKRSPDSLTDAERRLLGEIYFETGTPTDRLALDHVQLFTLADQFNRRAGKNASVERLLQELLTMRKRGKLPRLAGKSRPTPRRNST